VIRLLLKARVASFVAITLALGLLLIFGKPVSYEQSIKSFFADDDPHMAAYQRAARSFGDDNFAFVAYDDAELLTGPGMDRVAELSRELGPAAIPAVIRVESLDAMPLLWTIDDALVALDRLPAAARGFALNALRKSVKVIDPAKSTMTVGSAVRTGNATLQAAIRERITHHPLFVGTVIDRTGGTTALVVRLRKTGEHDVRETVARLRSIADRFAERHRLKAPAVVGPPVLLADGFTSIERDGRRLAVVGMVLIGAVTLSATQSLWWALVPIVAGWVVWLATETVLSVLNLKLSLSGGPLVAQIVVLTMPAASHLAIHFRDELRHEADPWAAARSTLRAVAAPIIWCAITGAIGYGALITSDVVPVQQFGAILGSCTLVAALLVMAVSPIAMLPPFRLEIPVRHGSSSWVAASMNRLTAWVLDHPARIIIAIVAIVVPLAVGMFRLRYETNYINLFKPESRVVNDYHAVESRLGGIGLVEVVVPVGDVIDTGTLDRFRSVEAAIATEGQGQGARAVGVVSLATLLDPEGRLAALPPDSYARTLAAKLELIAASPQGELIHGFWNPETGQARFLVRLFEQQPAPAKLAIFTRAVDAARATFGPESYLTGLSYLMTKTTEAIIVTQWSTLIWSGVGILLMLTIALRGPVLAALALVPTILAVALVLGLMGWLGIKLDMATALVASVALGLSVDDTFHCLLQYRRERATRDFRTSLFDSYSVTGPGVILSSLAVAVGFLALRFSEFAPFVNFGTMVGIATAGSTLGNLILLPACLTLGENLRVRRSGAPGGPGSAQAERPSSAASAEGERAG
jgi:predicted RND superfamily exporter protein